MTRPTGCHPIVQRRKSFVAAALVLGVVTSMSGCTSGGSILGTRDSACFRVLPTARHDVGPKPIFSGVLHRSPDVLGAYVRQQDPHVSKVPAVLVGSRRSAACLVAFRGSFTPEDVKLAWAPLPGPFGVAVAVIDESNDRLLATVLLPTLSTKSDQLPFLHRYAFQH